MSFDAAVLSPKVADNYHLIESAADLESAVSLLMTDSVGVGIDTETTGLDFFSDHVVAITLYGAGHGYFLPLDMPQVRRNLDDRVVRHELSRLSEWGGVKFFFNAAFDLMMLAKLGLSFGLPRFPSDLYDVSLAARALNEHDPRGLKDLVRKYLGHEEALSYSTVFEGHDVRTVPLEKVLVYAIHDAEWTRELGVWQAFTPIEGGHASYVDRAGLRDVVNLEMAVIPAVVDMMRRGVKINVTLFESLIPELERRSDAAKQALIENTRRFFPLLQTTLGGNLLGGFNPDSPEQVKAFLNMVGVPVENTSAKTLAKYANNPIVTSVLEYRGAHKLVTTYGEGLFSLIRNGRIHTHYNQYGADTGRFSSSSPNLQNIVGKGKDSLNLRGVFIPDPGHLFISADYSGQELRLMAHVSGDSAMIEALSAAQDLHRFTAARMFGVPEKEVTPEQRKRAKAVGFGILYGSRAPGLSLTMTREGAPTSVEDAQKLLDLYFATFPGVLDWMTETRRFLAKHLYTRTILGRKRRFPNYRDADGKERASIERSALNHVIQGSGADMVKLAIRDCYYDEQLIAYDCRPVLTVHDEIVFQVQEGYVSEATERIKEIMEHVLTLKVPIVVEQTVMTRWGEK
jgi:DNA polymerase-1